MLEATGFLLIIALIWATELFDLPHYLLGAPDSIINWRESLLETGLSLLLAIFIMWWSHRMISRIRHLEGLISVCSHCKKINTGDKWVPIDTFITEHSEAFFSHGICPVCLEKYYPDN